MRNPLFTLLLDEHEPVDAPWCVRARARNGAKRDARVSSKAPSATRARARRERDKCALEGERRDAVDGRGARRTPQRNPTKRPRGPLGRSAPQTRRRGGSTASARLGPDVSPDGFTPTRVQKYARFGPDPNIAQIN